MTLPPKIQADAERQSWKEALVELNAKALRERAEKVLQPIELTEELTAEKSFDDLAGILQTIIKKDYEAKVIIFCAMLLAQTESDQINIGFQLRRSAKSLLRSTECKPCLRWKSRASTKQEGLAIPIKSDLGNAL